MCIKSCWSVLRIGIFHYCKHLPPLRMMVDFSFPLFCCSSRWVLWSIFSYWRPSALLNLPKITLERHSRADYRRQSRLGKLWFAGWTVWAPPLCFFCPGSYDWIIYCKGVAAASKLLMLWEKKLQFVTLTGAGLDSRTEDILSTGIVMNAS